ncbi:MAG: hypothetical protein JOZ99_06500 [Actinobacteria bacterium]|nr:hypothetical protein [Actinomycetota bacterium]
MSEPGPAPAYYAPRRGAGTGRFADWWSVLHPPYTAWHLSYVVLGATVAPHVSWTRLVATLLAFLLAVGIAAHALDELNGRPLRTGIPAWLLAAVAVVALVGAIGLGVAGVERVGAGLVPFIVVGAALVVAYNLELFGGAIHTSAGFALAWGAFPVLTAYYAQASSLGAAAIAGAIAAFALSSAQRTLSTPARRLRRNVAAVDVSTVMRDGTVVSSGRDELLAPLERALRTMSWAMVALACGLALARAGGWS